MLAFVMRFPRVKAQGRSFYHCISRFVHGLYIFGTSGGRCAEAEEFLSLMRRWAALTGIQIRKYVLMANHFHIMCEVPEPKPLTQNEMLERIEAGYGSERAQKLRKQLAAFAQQPDGQEQSERLLEPYRQQMKSDLSFFMKQLKGCFRPAVQPAPQAARDPVVGAFQERAAGRRRCRGGDRRLHRSEPGASRTV